MPTKPKKLTRKKMPVVKRKPGRTSTFNAAVAQRIIDGLSKGTPLTVICGAMGKPGIRTVYDWMEKHPDFSADIARARDCGYDAIANRLRETARERGDSTGDVARDKLIVDTDMKLLAKWDPKRYGERTTTEVSGPNGGPINTVQAFELPPSQRADLESLIAAAREKIAKR